MHKKKKPRKQYGYTSETVAKIVNKKPNTVRQQFSRQGLDMTNLNDIIYYVVRERPDKIIKSPKDVENLFSAILKMVKT